MNKIYIFLLLIILFNVLNANGQQKQDTSLEAALDLSLEQLRNTKVTIATKSETKLTDVPSVVTIITSEQIKNIGARYLFDILQYIPGFEFSKGRTGFYNMGLRGVKDPLTNAKLLVLKDGNPFSDIMYGTGLSTTKRFDINSIKRIEIIRGPGSALYGRNAFIGVINIITKSAKEKNEVNVYANAGNFSTFNYGASYATKKDDFNAYFSIGKVNSDVTDSKLANGFGGESVWYLAIDNFYTTANIQLNNFIITGSYNELINGASIGPFATESNKVIKSGIYSIEYKKSFNSKINLNTKIYGTNHLEVQNIEIFKPEMTAELAPELPISAVYPNGMYATPSFDSYNYGIDINSGLNIIKNNQTLIGFQVDYYGLRNVKLKSSYDTYTSAPLTYTVDGNIVYRGKDTQIEETRGWIEGNGHEYYNYAFYLQNIYSPFNNLHLTLGGRYDIDSEIGAIFNPRLAIVWNAVKDFTIKALYGQAYRAPNAQEQYRLTGFTIGNKDLKPEKIRTSELSLNYNFQTNISTNFTFFYNILEDLIFAQGVTSGIPGSPYSNIGDNKSMGFEFEYKMLLYKKLYLYGNYSYTKSKNTVNQDGLKETYLQPDIAPHKINAGLNYKLLKYINLNINFIYRSLREKYYAINKQTGEYILDNNGNKTYVSQDKIGDFYLLNGKIRIYNFFKTMELSAEVYNIFDEKYYDQDTEHAHQPAREGRQFLFTISYKF